MRDATTRAVSGGAGADGVPAAALCANRGLPLAAGAVWRRPAGVEPHAGAGRVGGRATVHVGGLTGTPVATTDTPGLLAVPGAVVVAPLVSPLEKRRTVLVSLPWIPLAGSRSTVSRDLYRAGNESQEQKKAGQLLLDKPVSRSDRLSSLVDESEG